MYQRTTNASRRLLSMEKGVGYRNVSVPLVWKQAEQHEENGIVTIIPGHYERAFPKGKTFNVGSKISKGYKRALRVARRRVMRVLKQQGRPFTGKSTLDALMQAG